MVFSKKFGQMHGCKPPEDVPRDDNEAKKGKDEEMPNDMSRSIIVRWFYCVAFHENTHRTLNYF